MKFTLSLTSFHALVFVTILYSTSIGLHATNTTWTGNVNNNWFNAGNWDIGVPGLLDTASILSDSVIISATTDVKHLILSNAALVVTPTGKLRIINSDEIGMNCLNGRVHNFGLIRVNNSNTKGIHLTGTSNYENYGGSETIVGHSQQEAIRIDENATLQNSVNGLVRSDTCFSAVYNNGELLNAGTITLRSSFSTIPENIASLDNYGNTVNNGSIEVDSSVNIGIRNTSSFNNNGTIEVRNCGQTGIVMGGAVDDNNTFDNNGMIMVKGADVGFMVTGSTLINSGSAIITDCVDGIFILETAQLNNFTVLSISNLENNGINNSGRLNNRGEINIGTWGLNMGIRSAISNSDTLYNDITGKISLNGQNIGANGISNSSTIDTSFLENYGIVEIENTRSNGIVNSGNIINHNLINIHDLTNVSDGVSNQGLIKNSDSLIINEIGGRGIINSGTLNLQNGSLVDISNCGLSGVFNSVDARITNSGNLKIQDVDDNGIINTGFLQNTDSIIIQNSLSQGLFSIDSIINEATGVIHVSNINSSAQGFHNGISAYFSNLGKVIIYNIAHLGIENEAIFLNEGYIFVDSTKEVGFSNSQFFHNTDTLIITRTKGAGIENLGVMHNNTTGLIDVSLTDENYGIHNFPGHQLLNDGDINIRNVLDAGFANGGELVNNHDINIENVRQFGIWNSPGSIENSTSATIEVDLVVGNASGALLYNEENASVMNDGKIILGKLDIPNDPNTAGILCQGGSSFHITTNGITTVMDILNMNDLLHINGNAIFQVDGVFDISN